MKTPRVLYIPQVYVAVLVFHECHLGQVFQFLRVMARVQQVETLPRVIVADRKAVASAAGEMSASLSTGMLGY